MENTTMTSSNAVAWTMRAVQSQQPTLAFARDRFHATGVFVATCLDSADLRGIGGKRVGAAFASSIKGADRAPSAEPPM